MRRYERVRGWIVVSSVVTLVACQPAGNRLFGQTDYQSVTNKSPLTVPVPSASSPVASPGASVTPSVTPSASETPLVQASGLPSVLPSVPATPSPTPTPVPVVTLFAGTDRDATTDVNGDGKTDWKDTGGFSDGNGVGARFNAPEGIACDTEGNVFVADTLNHRIRKITRDGVVTTYAGTGEQGSVNGPRNSAKFNGPAGVAVSRNGTVYVADRGNCAVRKITPAGQVSTLAGPVEISGFASPQGYVNGTGDAARFDLFARLAVDANDNVYVTDGQNNCVRKITPAGVVTTVAGPDRLPTVDRDKNGVINVFDFFGWKDGPAAEAEFYVPYGMVLDSDGNIFVADNQNNRIRKISKDGLVGTLAGSEKFGVDEGVGTGATFFNVRAITREPSGNLLVVQPSNHMIRRVTPTGQVTNFAGQSDAGRVNGPVSKDGKAFATFNQPIDVAVDGAGTIYVLELRSHGVRRIQ
jgi:sugar lactone lactonase YvrE